MDRVVELTASDMETWNKIKAHVLLLMEAARFRNDNIELNEDQTAALRGEIASYKKLLSWGDSARKRT